MNDQSQKGQSAVETAIVMPLFLFIILSILQFGLIAQARYMAKYAAYRAARVGAMNHIDQDKMLAAAESTLLPVLAMPSGLFGAEVIQPADSATRVATKAGMLKLRNRILPPTSLKMVEVTVCGPLSGDVANITQDTLTGDGSGSANQVDFDDPRATMDPAGGFSPDANLQQFLATKLRVQVHLNYRMPIPFANFIISRAYLAMTLPSVMHMGPNPTGLKGGPLRFASNRHIYIAPIFESYAMRMQSNLYLKAHPLPDENLCVSWGRPNKQKDP